MWAVKPHYYRVGLSFYNFPYMFGLLFGLGLYARYRRTLTPSAATTTTSSPRQAWTTPPRWRRASA